MLRQVVLRILAAAIRPGAFAVRPQRILGGGGGAAAGDAGGGAAETAAAEGMVSEFVSGERVHALCSGVVLGALKLEAEDAEERLNEGMESMHAGGAEDEYQDEVAAVGGACMALILERAGDAAIASLLSIHAQVWHGVALGCGCGACGSAASNCSPQHESRPPAAHALHTTAHHSTPQMPAQEHLLTPPSRASATASSCNYLYLLRTACGMRHVRTAFGARFGRVDV